MEKKSDNILDLPNNMKLVSKKEYYDANRRYKQLMKNPPNLITNSPMEIYKWVESLITLFKSV